MGAEERQSQPDLKTKVEPLEKDARRFSFFRLVYVLERLTKGAPAIGQLGPASEERLRLRGDTSLIFASSDVSQLVVAKYPDGIDRARLSTAFMALYGSVSPLPAYFIEQLA